jgi:hypothetical protein
VRISSLSAGAVILAILGSLAWQLRKQSLTTGRLKD